MATSHVRCRTSLSVKAAPPREPGPASLIEDPRPALRNGRRPDVALKYVPLHSACLRAPHGKRCRELPGLRLPIVVPSVLFLLSAGQPIPG